MLLGAALVIAIQAAIEIRTPHHTPAPFTLIVLVLVIAVKEFLFRRVFTVGSEVNSTAVKADAWHHRSDAITSAAALVGISVAILGGPGWQAEDDWAAIAAACIIFFNGTRILRPAVADLMDHAPETALLSTAEAVARSVDGVDAIGRLGCRDSTQALGIASIGGGRQLGHRRSTGGNLVLADLESLRSGQRNIRLRIVKTRYNFGTTEGEKERFSGP